MIQIHSFKISHAQAKRSLFNLGLFYYKYLPLTKKEQEELFGRRHNPPGIVNDGKEKNHVLHKIVQLSQQLSPQTLQKRLQNIARLHRVQSITLITTSRLLCGVGYQHRLEWGLLFDWTTGFPYLPGSSIKGALLSYLEFLAQKPFEKWDGSQVISLENGIQISATEVRQIFGPQGSNIQQPAQGQVMFLDAYPEPEHFQGLEVDIITPHYSKYYTSEGKIPPADIYNPVPQPFLTVPEGTKFIFQMAPLHQEIQPQINKIQQLIIEAGQNYGFGAKTATGYGYFKTI